ncbi:uncharacterized protein [Triticum aestivum]|uniref:uncharacterized protein n=1 Tax=Triticum aestivum TaxID=4565 RepID=UPI001D0352FA|nr:uncharacterized protein LOC123038813 [Triticum aestivum]
MSKQLVTVLANNHHRKLECCWCVKQGRSGEVCQQGDTLDNLRPTPSRASSRRAPPVSRSRRSLRRWVCRCVKICRWCAVQNWALHNWVFSGSPSEEQLFHGVQQRFQSQVYVLSETMYSSLRRARRQEQRLPLASSTAAAASSSQQYEEITILLRSCSWAG